MAVSHVASAASGSTNPTTTFTVTIPTVSVGDVLFCAFTSRDHASGTAVPTCTDNDTGGETWKVMYNSTDRKAWVFWKRATSATSAKTITVAGCVGSCSGGVAAYSGAVATGTPYDQISLETNASANETHAGFTTLQNDSELCFVVFNYANDNSVSSVSAATAGAFTNRFEKLSTGGSDCATNFSSQPEATAGATGNITWSQTNGTTYSLAFVVVPAAADVDFPTTAILDDFNRANEDPISGGWSANPIYFGIDTARVVSNQMAARGFNSAHPYWATSFAADVEVYVTVANRANFDGVDLWARGADFNSGSFINDGYTVTATPSGSIRLSRIVNDSGTTIGEMYQPVATGDSLGIRCLGDQISAWYKPSGGSWRKLYTVTDTTLTSSGLVGLTAGATAGTVIFDDFGGGDYVPPSSGYTLTCDAGSFTLTGASVNILKGSRLLAEMPLVVPSGLAVESTSDTELTATWTDISYTLTGSNVTLTTGTASNDYTLTAEAGSFALTGQDAGLIRGLRMVADAGSFALTGSDVAFGRTVPATPGAYTFTGSDVTLTYTPLGAYTLTAEAGSFALTGQAAGLLHGRRMAAEMPLVVPSNLAVESTSDTELTATWEDVSYSLTGQDVTLTHGTSTNYTLTAEAGSFALTGSNVALHRLVIVEATVGVYTFTGSDVTLTHSALTHYTLTADAGSFALTGQDAALRHDRTMAAEAGTYTLIGVDASLKAGRVLTAEAGSYSLSGQAAALSHSYRLQADAGSYALSGQTVAFPRTYRLQSDAGSFTLTGIDAGLLYAPVGSYSIFAAAGSFSLTGQDVALRRDYTLTAEAGSFAVSGTDAAFRIDRTLQALAGSYALTGQDATLTYTPAAAYTLTAEAGSYALTGLDAALTYSPLNNYTLTADAGVYTFSGSAVTITYSGIQTDFSLPFAVSLTDASRGVTIASNGRSLEIAANGRTLELN